MVSSIEKRRRRAFVRVGLELLIAFFISTLHAGAANAQSCGTLGQSCAGGCDDGDECNGTEVCTGPIEFRICVCDSTPPCADGNPCTLDVCTETPRGVICDHLPGGCSDGVFCNGLEACAGHGSSCEAGIPPCAQDQVCDEANDLCVECLGDGDCSDALACTTDTCAEGQCVHAWCDSLFCDGRDLCRTQTGCAAGIPPCDNLEFCNEATFECGDCQLDDQCPGEEDCSIGACDTNWLTCTIDPCILSIDSPADGSVYDVGTLIDLVGHGPRGLDVLLVLDESGSMSDLEFEMVREFGVKLVQALPDFRFDGSGTKAGVITFSSGSRRVIDLSINRQLVINTIQSISHLGGSTCIGCGIDDASNELLTLGRAGAGHVIVMLTDGQNNLPPEDFASHLTEAVEACGVYNHVIFAVGVGDAVSPQQIQQIATPLPGRQTAFLTQSFSSLGNLGTAVANEMFMSVFSVELTLPDQSQAPMNVLNISGGWQYQDWAMLPGENVFTASILTLQGPRETSIILTGKYPCIFACGDMDGDTEIGLRDIAVFQRCFGHKQYDHPDCACADLSGELEVDFIDWSAILSAWDSPTTNQPPNCVAP